MFQSLLEYFKNLFFTKKELPPFDPKDNELSERLIKKINQERKANGLLELEELHELSECAKDNAKFYYQYGTVKMKPDNLILEYRLLKKEFSPAECGELANIGADSIEECLFSWLIKKENSGVLNNGYFTHVGVGKCKDCWSAVFARPRVI